MTGQKTIGTGEKLRQSARNFMRLILPQKIEKTEEIKEILRIVYPGHPDKKWESVTFYYGLPWIMYFAGTEASTQPATYHYDEINIYFRKDIWNAKSYYSLGVIVHECYHAIQYQQCFGGYGLGYFKAFLIPYLSRYFTNGRRREHFLERPAYDKEAVFAECCQKIKALSGRQDNSMPDDFYPEFIENLKINCPEIQKTPEKIKYWKLLWMSSPGPMRIKEGGKGFVKVLTTTWVIIWNIFIGLICVFIAFVKPLIEFFLLIAAGFLWAIAGIVSVF